jgi:hypothetical protein
LGVRIGHQAQSLITQGELGVTEEGLVGCRYQAPCHFQDGRVGSGLDPRRQFLRLGFQVGAQRFRHT